MTFIKDQNHRSAIEDKIIELLLDFRAVREDGLRLNSRGVNYLGELAVWEFDQTGKLGDGPPFRWIGDKIKEIRRDYPMLREEAPHVDVFPEIVSIETGIAYVKKNAGRIPGTRLKQLNELLKFVQDNNIHDQPSTEPAETPEQAANREGYTAVRERVSALTGRDCGNVYSAPGGGAWEKVNNLKRRLFNYIDACEKNRIPAATVSERVSADVEAFRSTSRR